MAFCAPEESIELLLLSRLKQGDEKQCRMAVKKTKESPDQ